MSRELFKFSMDSVSLSRSRRTETIREILNSVLQRIQTAQTANSGSPLGQLLELTSKNKGLFNFFQRYGQSSLFKKVNLKIKDILGWQGILLLLVPFF